MIQSSDLLTNVRKRSIRLDDAVDEISRNIVSYRFLLCFFFVPLISGDVSSRRYGGGSFSFANLINGVTKRFSTEFELQQVREHFEMIKIFADIL